MNAMETALNALYDLVTSVTGKQPEVFDSELGRFRKAIGDGATWEMKPDKPLNLSVLSGSIQVSYAGQRRIMKRGQKVTIGAALILKVLALEPTEIGYSFVE